MSTTSSQFSLTIQKWKHALLEKQVCYQKQLRKCQFTWNIVDISAADE